MHTPMADVEVRIGIQPVEELLAERDALVKKVAPLRARYAAFGTFEALRKIELASVAESIRARARANGKKLTEDAIKDAAHADARYVKFVTEATSQRAKWAELEDLIQGVNDTINRGQAVARFVSAEVHLG